MNLKSIFSALFVLFLTSAASAENFRCIANPQVDGDVFWLTMNWNTTSTNKSAQFELLAENGFYSQVSFAVKSFTFTKDTSITLVYADATGVPHALVANYDANKENYKGTDVFGPKQNPVDFTCMELKGF
ncbi:MAG: hypothetical protein H6623_06735 [Bdellovibrionaceae bacterium]|nr:hypothetical protein [Pseudobdellovibrionaceae bacterium]